MYAAQAFGFAMQRLPRRLGASRGRPRAKSLEVDSLRMGVGFFAHFSRVSRPRTGCVYFSDEGKRILRQSPQSLVLKYIRLWLVFMPGLLPKANNVGSVEDLPQPVVALRSGDERSNPS